MLALTLLAQCLVVLTTARPEGSHAPKHHASLKVETTVGRVHGFIDKSAPDVKQWAGIPFAEPPVGQLRFAAPVPKSRSFKALEATKIKPQCPQWLSDNKTIYNQYTPGFLPSPPYDEDCLYLNVFAPARPKGKKLPVLVWLHGGELRYGGTHTPYEEPQNWVQRSQEHIVIYVSYRLNILGFPNARALPSSLRNVGFLDQRLALEWARDNAAAFGGDTDRIIFWGHSAGAASVQILDFAYPDDPIVAGFIAESGVAAQVKAEVDPEMTSFDTVAAAVACGNVTGNAQIKCMRGVSATKLEAVLKAHNDKGIMPPLAFSLSTNADNIYSAAQYIQRGNAGLFSKKPLLFGSDSEEGSAFVPFPAPGQPAPNSSSIKAATLAVVQCAVASTQSYRAVAKAKTYRYLYAGNFTDISPVPWLGASHFSIVPLITGAHIDSRTAPTRFEKSLSHRMQNLWLDFAKDPTGNALDSAGWPATSSTASQVAVLGRDGKILQLEGSATIDSGCT